MSPLFSIGSLRKSPIVNRVRSVYRDDVPDSALDTLRMQSVNLSHIRDLSTGLKSSSSDSSEDDLDSYQRIDFPNRKRFHERSLPKSRPASIDSVTLVRHNTFSEYEKRKNVGDDSPKMSTGSFETPLESEAEFMTPERSEDGSPLQLLLNYRANSDRRDDVKIVPHSFNSPDFNSPDLNSPDVNSHGHKSHEGKTEEGNTPGGDKLNGRRADNGNRYSNDGVDLKSLDSYMSLVSDYPTPVREFSTPKQGTAVDKGMPTPLKVETAKTVRTEFEPIKGATVTPKLSNGGHNSKLRPIKLGADGKSSFKLADLEDDSDASPQHPGLDLSYAFNKTLYVFRICFEPRLSTAKETSFIPSRVIINKSPFVIGSDPSCDLVLSKKKFKFIAPKHCKVVYQSFGPPLTSMDNFKPVNRDKDEIVPYRVKILKASPHGTTYINNSLLRGNLFLENGDLVSLGPRNSYLTFRVVFQTKKECQLLKNQLYTPPRSLSIDVSSDELRHARLSSDVGNSETPAEGEDTPESRVIPADDLNITGVKIFVFQIFNHHSNVNTQQSQESDNEAGEEDEELLDEVVVDDSGERTAPLMRVEMTGPEETTLFGESQDMGDNVGKNGGKGSAQNIDKDGTEGRHGDGTLNSHHNDKGCGTGVEKGDTGDSTTTPLVDLKDSQNTDQDTPLPDEGEGKKTTRRRTKRTGKPIEGVDLIRLKSPNRVQNLTHTPVNKTRQLPIHTLDTLPVDSPTQSCTSSQQFSNTQASTNSLLRDYQPRTRRLLPGTEEVNEDDESFLNKVRIFKSLIPNNLPIIIDTNRSCLSGSTTPTGGKTHYKLIGITDASNNMNISELLPAIDEMVRKNISEDLEDFQVLLKKFNMPVERAMLDSSWVFQLQFLEHENPKIRRAIFKHELFKDDAAQLERVLRENKCRVMYIKAD